ncbi:MAG: tetratricopeptide repeat protein [Vicinamibacteria bacterium]|nr:tetratricopeptide repeat protein [Vicinamibacteria bacterium]
MTKAGASDLLAVADVARRAGDGALARRALNEARSLFPEDPAVHFAFGQDCLLGDDIDRAREAFARVVELDPRNVRAWINYGATCGEADLADEAARALERALELDPGSRDALSNLGVLRREAGRLDEAEKLFRRVLAMDPGFVFGYYNLAHCLFLAGRFGESAEQYRAGLRRDPLKTASQNARLAWALLAAGQDKDAGRELKRALERIDASELPALREEASQVLRAIEALRPADRAAIDAIRRLLPA